MEESKAYDHLVDNTPKPIKWVIPDSIRTDHATQLIVQQQGTEFTLLFFETETLLFTGTLEEQIAAHNAIPLIHAKCVAKLVMSAENVGLATSSLLEALTRFTSTLSAKRKKGQENAGTPEHTEPSIIS